MKQLPIHVTLVDRKGFSINHKEEVTSLVPVIYIMDLAKQERLSFRLDKYRQVKQKNGKPHIVAVYREELEGC